MRKRMMIPLDHIVEFQGLSIVARDREAHGIRTFIAWKLGAVAARIAEVAERADNRILRLPHSLGNCAADTRPGATQRKHRLLWRFRADARFRRKEVGTGHLRGIV